MNNENLHELINRYEQNYYLVNNSEHDEIFKWRAVKQFHDVWHSEKLNTLPFSKLFNEAKSECSILIDNSQVAPTNGIVKLAECCSDEVKVLFTNILFAETNDVDEIQNNMENFLEQIELIRQREMPQNWKYKQDRHAVSCYLSFVNPEKHYIYRYSEAEEFAKYIEFGIDIGSGENFKLSAYYKMADLVVEALKEHPSLLDKYFTLISDESKYYQDKSLHLLAFDLMYCCRAYNFYNGLTHALKKDSVKAYKLEQLREAERKQKEEQIASLQSEIHSLEIELEQYSNISLIGVEVTQNKYGKGIVVAQNGNMVTIKFGDQEVKFVLGNMYLGRPRFENDGDIVEAFTKYAQIVDELKRKNKELERVLASL